jgi:hypothetical protein
MKPRLWLMTVTVLVLGFPITNNAQYDSRDFKCENKTVQLVSVFFGKFSGWENNDDYVYHGFYLQTKTEIYLVKFSPNMGDQLVSEIKPGNYIQINAVEEKDTLKEKTVMLVSITIDGKYIYNRVFNESTKPPVEDFVFGSSKIKQLQKNRLGQVKGLILEDKTILRIPPNIIEQLNKEVIIGTYISYSGYQTLRNGEFALVNYPVVRCITFTVNEKQYLIM